MKIPYLSTVLLYLMFTCTIFGQPYLEWEAQFVGSNPTGNDEGLKILLDQNNNVIVGGKTASLLNFDYLIIKFNNQGDTLWTRVFNGIGNGNDEIVDIEIDPFGNIYVSGKSMGLNSGIDIVTLKYDQNGNKIWQNSYNNFANVNDVVYDIQLDNFGNLLIAGAREYSSSVNDGLILKLDNNGLVVWDKVINNWQGGEKELQVKINKFDNIITANSLNSGPTEILEFNPLTGDQIFDYNFAGGKTIQMKLDETTGDITLLTQNGNQNVILTKFRYHVPNNYFEQSDSGIELKAIDFEIDKFNFTYVLTNRFSNNFNQVDIRKIDPIGNEVDGTEIILTQGYNELPQDLVLTSTDIGMLYVTSTLSTGNIKITKFDSTFVQILSVLYDCGNNNSDAASSIIADNCDNIYITGYSACNNTGQDLKTIKYSTLSKPKITPSKPNPICENETLILYADTCSTCTYLWSNGNTADSILINPDTTSEYQVTVTNNNGCEIVSLPFKVIVKKLLKPEITITPSANSICVGAGTNVMAQTINAGANPGYAWYVNGTLQAGQNSASLPISPLINSQVQCILTTSEQCYVQQKDTSNTINVTVNPLPLASITALGNTTFCSGNNVLLAPSQSTSYLWSNGSTIDTITVTESGKYKVTLTDSNGCSNVSNEIIVNVNALPLANIMKSGSEIFCNGDSVILTASSASQYSWSNGATGNQIVVKNSGQFIVTITDQNGCKSSSQIINVVANPLPVLNIISSGDLNLCQGESETLTSSTAGNLYKWSNGQSTPSITVTENGTYQLSVTDANGCQGVASPVTITVHALPVVSINSSGPVTFCQGSNVILTASNASTYLWSNGITTQSTTISSNGSYSVIVTDANGCKNSSSPITINVNPLPIASIVPSGTIHFCMGDSIKLVANGGNQYLWSNTMSTKEIMVKEPANYQVTVTDANGCSAISLPTLVVVDTFPHIVVNVLGSLQFCDGDSVALEAQNADTYVWSNGANSHRIAIKNSGSYNVTGTNSYGCKSVSPTYTSEKQELVTPKVEISTPDLSVCEGAVVTFITNTIGGGNEPSFQWFVNSIPQTSNSSTYNSNSLINGSSIYCIMTSSENCVTIPSDKSNVLNIAVNALKTPTIEIIQESAEIFECEDGVYKSQISNGGSNPKFKWYINDIQVASGASFTYSEFIQGDKVNCLLESNAECLTTNNVISNTLYPTVIKKSQPSITVIDGKIQPTNYSTNKYTYKWFLNGVEISNNEIIECADFGPGEYYLEVSINGCTFPSQSKQIENCSVATEDLESKEVIIVYPNPTRGIIQLKKGEGTTEEFQIRITNLLGTEVLEAKSSQYGTIDVSSLEAGVYYLTLNKINVIKIIKI